MLGYSYKHNESVAVIERKFLKSITIQKKCVNYDESKCVYFARKGREFLILNRQNKKNPGGGKDGNLLSFLLRCSTRPHDSGHPMRIELTRVGSLVYLANHYTTRGAPGGGKDVIIQCLSSKNFKTNQCHCTKKK